MQKSKQPSKQQSLENVLFLIELSLSTVNILVLKLHLLTQNKCPHETYVGPEKAPYIILTQLPLSLYRPPPWLLNTILPMRVSVCVCVCVCGWEGVWICTCVCRYVHIKIGRTTGSVVHILKMTPGLAPKLFPLVVQLYHKSEDFSCGADKFIWSGKRLFQNCGRVCSCTHAVSITTQVEVCFSLLELHLCKNVHVKSRASFLKTHTVFYQTYISWLVLC